MIKRGFWFAISVFTVTRAAYTQLNLQPGVCAIIYSELSCPNYGGSGNDYYVQHALENTTVKFTAKKDLQSASTDDIIIVCDVPQ